MLKGVFTLFCYGHFSGSLRIRDIYMHLFFSVIFCSLWSLHCDRDGLIMAQHYTDVIITTMESQITSLTVVYSIVSSGANQRKHQSSASLAFVRGIHRWPVNSPHKGPVTRKMFPFDDVIMGLVICPHIYKHNRTVRKRNKNVWS